MPKRKQGKVDNEGVQDFELIELLIRETEGVSQPGPGTSTQQRSDFESFKARFQSYVDQVPSYLHSVGKEGFFPHFFLGSFSTLIDTEIAKKLKIKKIYFRFDTSGTLKVAVISHDKIQSYEDVKKHVKLISISEHNSDNKNCKFTSGDLVEILKKCLTPPKGKSIQAEAQDIKDAFKGPIDSVLEMDFRLIQISRNNINKEGINVEVIDTRVLNSAVSKGFHEVRGGLWSNPESDIAKLTNPDVKRVKEPIENILKKVSEIHSGYRDSLVYADQAREAAHHGFVAGALVNFRYRHNLRVYLEQFAGRGYADIVLVPRGRDRSLNSIPIVIELKAATKEELEQLRKGSEIKANSKTTPSAALKQAEDYTKGFQPNVMRVLTTANDILCVGVNLDHPSPISGIMDKPRDQEITPLFNDIMESIDKQNNGEITQEQLKTQIQENIERIYHTFPGTGEKGDSHYFSRFLSGQSILLDKALEIQFKKYIFIPNIITYAKFCNLLLDACDQISKPEVSKIVRNLMKEVESVDLGLIDPEIVNIVRKIKEENGKNVEIIKNIIKKDIVEKDGVKEKIKEVLRNENIPTEALRSSKQPLRTAAPRKEIDPDPSYAIVTMVFIPEEGSKKLTYVMNIIEADGRAEVISKGIPLDKLKQEIGNRKVVELNLNFNVKKQKSDFKEYFSMEVSEPIFLEQYNNKKTDKFKGNFENVPYPDGLKRTFDEALGSQRSSTSDQPLSIDRYNELLRTVGKGVLPLKPLIEKEAHFQAVLHGAFSHYSDMKLGELQENRALVLTEFQTGRGKRIDMVVHGIKFADQASSAKEYDPVGLELKGPREGKTADALKDEANKQIADEYTKGVTYKTLTDGKEVAFMGVVFDKGANNADSLVLMSKDEFASVKVVHSSIFSFSQQQCSKGRKQRSTGMACIDSFDEEKITEEEKKQRVKKLFDIDNAKDLTNEIIDIGREQVFDMIGNADRTDVYVKVKDNNGNDKKLIIGDIIEMKNAERYFVDDYSDGIEILVKVGRDKDRVIKEKIKGQNIEYYLSIDGYEVKFDDIIKNFTTDAEREKIHNKLHQLSNDKQLLENKKYIEDIGDVQTNQDYNNIVEEIKQNLLAKGVREDTFDRFKSHFDDLGEKVFADYISNVESSLQEKGIAFDRDKFDSAKIQGAKGGKFFSMMAIYDLLDSIGDTATLGRHNNDALKQVFGINGILDAMDDVRTSVSISSNSKVGRLISKIPQPVRQTFVKIISNPVVQSITFATIAYQFGYSVNEIAQGNHHPLNYYWTASSGIKLASMSIRPISAGVSFTVRNVSATTKVLRGLSAAGKVLGRASVVTMVADVLITIGVEIHERIEYTKAIAEQVPLLPGGEQAEVFFAGVIKFFTRRDVEKEYEDIIRVKGYLNHVKEVAIRLLDDNYNVAAVVQYVFGIKEEYNKLISGYSKNMPASMNDQSSYICQFKNNYTSLSFENQHNESSNLSSLDLFNTLSLTLHTLVMSKGWEEFKCAFTKNLQCRQTVRDKEVYVIDRGKKYLPDITKYEYEDVGLRVVDVPLGTLSERNLKCSGVINIRECSDSVVIGNEVRHIQPKDIGKVHKSCTHELVIHSNNIKPFVFTSPTRKDPYHIRRETFPRDSVLYISLPRIFTAIANYPAVMHVPEGSSIRCTGSKNNETIFIINDRTSGTLEGGAGKENTLVMNVKDSNIVADLYSGTIHYSNNDNIRLVNTYNYVSNSDSKQSITTHCKTRLINAKNAEVWQNSFNCADKDYEVRVVNKEDIHHRGLKQTIFIVNKDSNNTRIVSDFNYTEKIKKNIDVIDVQVVDITRLSVNESIERGSYSLDFLADSTQNIVSSIKIDSFKNLVIQAKRLGVIESVIIQDKSLSNIIEDMRCQKLSDLGKDIDREVIQNSEKKLKAVIKASILDLEWPNTYQAAKNIADNNNLGIPISEVEVIKNYVGVPTEKVIIAGTYSDRIIVDFSYSDSNPTHSHLRYRANGGNYDYDQYMIVCNYYQDIMIEGKEEQDRYVVKFPEYGQMLQHNILGSHIELDLNLKVKNKATLYQNVPDDIIDLTMLNVVDVDSISIKKGKRTYFNKCNSREVSDLTDNSLEIKNVTVSDNKGIKWSLSIGLVDYFRGQEYQNIVLQINNKFYKINNANLELEYVEVNAKPFRYYQPDEQGLQIYHNQPVNKNVIGLVDLKEKSILSFNMKVVDDNLSLLHKNNTITMVENWNTYQPARKMIFAFNDTIVSNLDCIAFTCNSGNVIYAFNKAKETLLKEQLFNAIRQDNTNEVKNLIRRITGSTDAEDKHELTSLYIAIQEGRSDVVKFLFDRKFVNVKDEDIHGNSPLHWAALEGELSITQFLVNEGANIEGKNKGNQTPEDLANQEGYSYIAGFLRQIQLNRELLTAAEGGNLNKVKDLSKKGANLETKNNSGFTPLHYTSLYNHFEVVEYLVGRRANLEAKDNNGCTPLHYVSLKDYQLKIMDYLTKSGANLEAKDNSGRTPLHYASLNGSLKLVKYLIKAKASLEVRDNSDRTPLHNACLSKNLKVVKYLINNGADLEAKDSNGKTPLHYVSLDGYSQIVEYLIKRGANLEVKDKDGKTPLELAIQGSYTNVVKILKQAQLDKKLFTAVESGDLNEVTNLITQGDYINATDKSDKTSLRYSAYEGANIGAKDLYGWTPLHYAIYRNDLDILEFLLDKGANIEAKDINDETPLHIAAKDNNKSKVVRILLDKGARTEDKNKVGWTPLHIAAYKDNLDVCKLLLERNADVEAKNTYDETPLHVAAENSNKSKVTAEFLLDKGANINAKNKDGWTPLHYAAYKDNLDVCKLLIKRGTSIEARDNGDRAPLDVARDEEHNNIVEYLERKLKEEREKPAQRKRRHHHGDHNSHNLSRKPLAIDQPQIATSSGAKPSSWINDLFSRVKSSVGRLLSSKSEGTASSVSQVDGQFAKASISNSSFTGTTLPSDGTDKRQENGDFFRDNVDYVNANLKRMCERQAPVKFKPSGGNTILEMGDHYLSQVDFNGTITLFDLLIRRVTGKKYISIVDQSISPLEAQGYALNITKGCEKVLEQAGLKSGVSMHRLNIDYMGMQKEITRKVMSGKFNEISGILKLYIEKACPSREAGKLSSKKFDKFMVEFNSGLNVVLNQSIKQILHNRDGRLEVDDAKQMSLDPQSYLSNASVHSHSKVSTCLSEIGVTKLGGNLNR